MKRNLFVVLMLTCLVSIVFALPRNLVVVEIGTGTWCQYCPGAAMGADDLVDNGHAVAIIENHNGDNYANTYSNARNTYYGITGYPTAFFDGLNPTVGGSNTQSMYSNYLVGVNARLSVASHYTISAVGTMEGNNINLYATVQKPEDDTNTNVLLHCVITESDIQQNWQGQTHLNFVTRLMAPNQSGSSINLATGEQVTIPLTTTWNTSWNIAHAEVIFFLQNNSTKEILQGVKYSLPGLLGASPISTDAINFPDVYVSGTTYSIFNITNYFDTPVTGTMSFDNPVFSVDNPTFTIPGFQSVPILVYFSPTAAQTYTGNLTINSNLQEFEVVTIPLTGTGFVNNAPAAQDVYVDGPPVIHQDLVGHYSFSDVDGHIEGNTSFQWVRIIGGTPTPIAGANTPSYRIVEEDVGYPLAFEVTPRDQHGMAGIPTLSEYTDPIIQLPPPQNLSAAVTPPNTVILNWERPEYFDRGFVGYRVYRGGLLVQTITNPSTTTFTDTYVPDGTHEYWVCSLFSNPMLNSEPSNVVSVNIGMANSDELAPAISRVTAFPNPFKSHAHIEVVGKANRPIRLEIYNLKGQLVNVIESNTDGQGQATLIWNAFDASGQQVKNGIYLYRTISGEQTVSGKIVVNK
ncbi:MAG: Omp28-related outer membrane protein [Candidatus Cloacimonetes bacterium]|nr:Omp28-related outer membrane protein [Candidatus Cloacimonadota bacterium]